jgi:hypothetical protein
VVVGAGGGGGGAKEHNLAGELANDADFMHSL